MKKLLKFVVNRAKERSTYIGLFSVLGAFGAGIHPEMAEAIISAGVGAAGLVSMLVPDRKLPEVKEVKK